MSDLITLIIWGMVILVILLQFFLSLRPFFLWGLVPPLLFAALWYYFGSPGASIPILDLPLNETAVGFYAQVGQLGLLVSGIIFAFCRLGLVFQAQAQAKRRAKRRAAKEERLHQAKLLSGLQDGYGESTAEFTAPPEPGS